MANSSGDVKTIQTNIHDSTYSNSITDYALFLGGTNVAHDVLEQYDPLKTGYARLFMVRQPIWVAEYFKNTPKMNKFKHILEYGNVSVSGLSDISVQTNQITGGYVGKSFEIPSYASDDTSSLSVQVYEYSGSPIREVLHEWINGSTDLMSGLTHYNGLLADTSSDAKLIANQANQTAEFIYVVTDCTGMNVEYACMFANCFPKNIPLDPFNYSSGQHDLVETTIEFTATKYESIQINQIAKRLIDKYKVLTNSLNFFSGFNKADFADSENNHDKHYNEETGKLENGNQTFKESMSPSSKFID